jgi:hypothetical protein
MLNPTQVAGLVVISLLLAMQLRFAAKAGRPVLWIITLVFFVYFVYSGGIRLRWIIRQWSHNFDVSEHYLTVATWLVVVLLIAVRIGYAIPQKMRTRAAAGVRIYNQQLLLVLSLLGLGTMALAFYLNGALAALWSRQIQPQTIPWAGVLSGLNGLALIYPLFNYYYYEDCSFFGLVTSVCILTVYGGFAAVSGVATGHILRLAPFLLIWLKRRALTIRRAAAVLIAGFVVFSFLRFNRQLGATLVLGGGLTDAYQEYIDPDNPLNAANSFDEFVTFSQVVKVVDTSTDWQLGGSYLLAPMSLVPGVIFPEKADMLLRMPAGFFLPLYYGVPGVSWPVGFYGEAYMNFGLPGLIAVSILFGWCVHRAELLLRSEGSFYWLPHWYIGCVLTATLIVHVRNDSVEAVGFVVLIGLAVVLGQAMSLMVPYGPVRYVKFPQGAMAAVD